MECIKNCKYIPADKIKVFHCEQGIGVHHFIGDKYYLLENISAEIWSLLNGLNSVEDVIKVLHKKYEVEYEVIENDVNNVFQYLIKCELIKENF